MSGYSWSCQVPRAPLHIRGVTSHAVMSCTTSTGVTLSSSLILAHASVLNPPDASENPCTSGLCRLLAAPAGRRTFPALSLRIFLCVLGPLPRLLSWCTCPLLPTRLRPSRRFQPVGAWQYPRYSNFSMDALTGLQSFANVERPEETCFPPKRLFGSAG